MDILSAIFTIAVWVFIGSAIKKSKKKSASSKQGRPVGTPTSAAAPRQPVKTAAPAKPRTVTAEEAKKRLEKAKPAYTPVTLPKAEGEGTDVSRKGHVVQSSFTPGAHVHEETSMTGFEACPTERPAAKKRPDPIPEPVHETAAAKTPVPAPAFSVAFTREETLRAIIYSEILSKPKALR